ncbi:MAG: aspartate/glutamate racemase family protein [Chloroflexota bacterium]|nr:aspartate/glutamate racemase family protein [Chloroflexota bacterium]
MIHLLDNLATVSGVAAMLASIRQVGIPVLELNGDGDATFVRLIEVCRRSVGEDQADGFVLGCGTLSFRAAKLQEVVGVSVVNPLQVALRAADMLVGCNLTHSKRSYPVPLKLAPEALAVGG